MRELSKTAQRWAAQRRTAEAVLARPVTERGFGPRHPGDAILIDAAGACHGTLYLGAFDRQLAEEAVSLAPGHTARVCAVAVHDEVTEAGLTCGGQAEILLQPLPIMLSHEPDVDIPTLHAALTSGIPYVGALGSRRTQERRAAGLVEAGLDEAHLGRIHGPIGLDIAPAPRRRPRWPSARRSSQHSCVSRRCRPDAACHIARARPCTWARSLLSIIPLIPPDALEHKGPSHPYR
ncbi:XdhC family protein [Streptomyces sp. NBC_01530]|uniref:XdhC family protein n=2 Tax=unclassified Streptomyces TaxID=2593676 RepID=UPI00386CC3B5